LTTANMRSSVIIAMNVGARVLTTLFVLLLMANFQISALSCGMEPGSCSRDATVADCCFPAHCHCNMVASRAGRPCSQAPVNVTTRQNAPIAGVTAYANTTYTQTTGRDIAAPISTMAASFDTLPLYAQTHAFLI
jgi:hypothetical protein